MTSTNLGTWMKRIFGCTKTVIDMGQNVHHTKEMDFDLTRMKEELLNDEGIRLTVYEDSEGIPTIGVGRNLKRGITEFEAEMLLVNDVSGCVSDLDMSFPWWKDLTPVRQRALLNMCFNLGLHRLMGFRKMLKALREGDYMEASIQAIDSKWAKQVGSRAQRIAVQLQIGE